MIRLNIHEAKTHLSAVLARLRPGETILLCRRNKPVAEIRALAQKPTKRRPIGLEAGKLVVPESFFEPLPKDVIESFYAATR